MKSEQTNFIYLFFKNSQVVIKNIYFEQREAEKEEKIGNEKETLAVMLHCS